MNTAGLIVLVVSCVLGVGIVLFGLPGLFVISAGYLGYGLLSGGVNWAFFAMLLFIAILGEVGDIVVSALGAKKFGTSRNGIIGALIGAVVGAIVGVPIFLVGSVVGMLVGAFCGAFAFEYYATKDRDVALKSATGALLGKITAIITKFVLAVISVIAIVVKIV